LDEAMEQYRQALALAPRQAEALLNLAALLALRDEQEDALACLRALAAIKPRNKKEREMILIADEILAGDLSLDELEIGNPLVLRQK
jgi:tetratricopeptide (TPR) repeat protein